jgi:hypothetical protein
MRRLLGLVLAAALAPALTTTAAADDLAFTTPQKLPKYSGGEPSLAFDPSGNGDTYVVAPQGIPTAVVGPITGNFFGIGFWGSKDGGKTFPNAQNIGAGNGGGDSDVVVGLDHTVYAADLEATAAAICISTDEGKTFPDCDNGVATNQQGPENDRQWLTPGPKANEIYLTYHDFAAGFPIIEKSTDSGQSFQPCGTIIDPAGPAAQTYTPQGGTLVSKPVLGKDGTIYVEFTTPDQAAAPVGAPLNHLYMAVLPKGECSPVATFTDHPIYTDPGADLAKIFQVTAIDGAGNLYVGAGGHLKAGQKTTDLYVFRSTDGGKTWTAPVQVNSPDLKANVLPGITGGPGNGQVAIGWFGTTTSGDPNTLDDQWRYYAATSFDQGKTWGGAIVTEDPIHYGDICTQGIFCGLIPGQPGNRNLADFSSLATDPSNGCVAIALPGDPQNRPDLPDGDNDFSSSAYVARQSGGACLSPAIAQPKPGNPGTSPAPTAGTSFGGQSPCQDKVAPQSRFTRRGSRLRRQGLRLHGTSKDTGCFAVTASLSREGRVQRVLVSIGKEAPHKRCRFLQADKRFSAPRSCLRTSYLPAKARPGTSTTWSLSLRARLPRGGYKLWVRGIDTSRNTERKLLRRNFLRLRVR